MHRRRGVRSLIARNRKLLSDLKETFWVIPGLMVLAGVVAAYAFVRLDHSSLSTQQLAEDAWLYRGGPAGARAVLGAIASSTIAVAGTVFSITIAALSLASGQMGPRLLHNFTRDRGNQITLGAFIGTFVYALMVLRTVRSPSEGEFVPHLALTVAILLAFVCVAMLVWFVAHMAERINVDTVIDLVSSDVNAAADRLTVDTPQQPPPPEEFWRDAAPIIDRRCGYLQQLDADGLADWVFHNHAAMRLLVRPGDYVFPNTPIAVIKPRIDGAGEAILNARRSAPSAAARWISTTPSPNSSRLPCARCRPASTIRKRPSAFSTASAPCCASCRACSCRTELPRATTGRCSS